MYRCRKIKHFIKQFLKYFCIVDMFSPLKEKRMNINQYNFLDLVWCSIPYVYRLKSTWAQSRGKRNGSISKSQGITRVEKPGQWIQNSGRGKGGQYVLKTFPLCVFVPLLQQMYLIISTQRKMRIIRIKTKAIIQFFEIQLLETSQFSHFLTSV